MKALPYFSFSTYEGSIIWRFLERSVHGGIKSHVARFAAWGGKPDLLTM